MACFITPLVVGIILAIINKAKRFSEKYRLDILTYMMLGGALILAVEHAWHGEIVPWPPFLTAMKEPGSIDILVSEILRVGGTMSLSVTGVWALISTTAKKLQVKISMSKPISSAMGVQ